MLRLRHVMVSASGAGATSQAALPMGRAAQAETARSQTTISTEPLESPPFVHFTSTKTSTAGISPQAALTYRPARLDSSPIPAQQSLRVPVQEPWACQR